MTLCAAVAAGVRSIVWCKACQHQSEPDPAEMATRCTAEMPVLEWHKRLVCSRCGGREIDFVLTGASEAVRVGYRLTVWAFASTGARPISSATSLSCHTRTWSR
jgi:hypothetical protein